MRIHKEDIMMVGVTLMAFGFVVLLLGMGLSLIGNDNSVIPTSIGVLFILVGMVACTFVVFLKTLSKEIEEIKKSEMKNQGSEKHG